MNIRQHTATSDHARPIDVLPLLREDRSLRVLALPALLVLAGAHAALLAPSTLRDDGLGATVASLVGAAAAVLAATTAASLVKLAFTDRFTQAVPLTSRLFAPGLILPVALAIYGVVSAALDAPPLLAFVAACLASGAVLRAVRRHRRTSTRSRAYRSIGIGHPTDAEELIGELREELRHPSPGVDRSAVELLLAATIADTANLVDRYDDLGEAERILARSLPDGNPAGLVGAATSIVMAAMASARDAGDVSGLEQTLELVDRTIACVPSMVPMFRSLLLTSHSSGMLLLREQAQADGDDETAQRLLGAAIGDLEQARGLLPRWSSDRADVDVQLASLTWMHPQLGGLDASIDRCRAALRSLRLRRPSAREEGQVTLACLLAERAGATPSPAALQATAPGSAGGGRDGDLAEAVELCERAARRGRRPHQALPWLPAFLDAAGADDAVVGAAFRRAFAALCAVSFDDAGGLAMDWLVWADERRNAAEGAEAHFCFIRTLVTELQRRRLRGEPLAPWELEGVAEGAALRLLAAGREREAALALDLGSGIGMNARMYRERGDIGRRLTEAGREDLADRWLLVGERTGPQARPSGDPRRRERAGTITVGGQTFRGRFASRDFMPLADYERLVREIGRTPGFEDVDAPARYEDLREAAGEGPLVYVGATAEGGFAVVVTEDGAQPQVVTLGALSSDEVTARAEVLMGMRGADTAAAALEPTLAWLWRTLLEPLAAALPAAQLVTLLPVGALGLLPIHAAGMARRRDGTWHDRTGGLAFRYAPNARLLARAQATARSIGTVEQAVAAVDDPGPGGHAPSGVSAVGGAAAGASAAGASAAGASAAGASAAGASAAGASAAGLSAAGLSAAGASAVTASAAGASALIADRLGAGDLLTRPPSSTAADVLDALGEAPIWLLACRVEHDPVAPLSTCLRLATERLSLDTLLAPDRAAPRLVVLTSCRTAIVGDPGADELVGLPSALLNAGAAGVVASHMPVDERAATALTVDLFRRLSVGTEPARALAQAQGWLAAVSNGELADVLGPAYDLPPDLPAALRRDWEGRRPFTDPLSWAGFSYCGA